MKKIALFMLLSMMTVTVLSACQKQSASQDINSTGNVAKQETGIEDATDIELGKGSDVAADTGSGKNSDIATDTEPGKGSDIAADTEPGKGSDVAADTGSGKNSDVAADAETGKSIMADEETIEHKQATDITDCDTFTQIVDKLENGKGYANATLGSTDVLLISSGTYDNGDNTMAAIDAEIFCYDSEGSIEYLGYVECGGTAYPLSVMDGAILSGGNHFMSSHTVKDGRLVLTRAVYESFDKEGNATYTYKGEEQSDHSQTELKEMLDHYYETMGDAEIISFQPVGGKI